MTTHWIQERQQAKAGAGADALPRPAVRVCGPRAIFLLMVCRLSAAAGGIHVDSGGCQQLFRPTGAPAVVRVSFPAQRVMRAHAVVTIGAV